MHAFYRQAQASLTTRRWPQVTARPNALASATLPLWLNGDLALCCVHPWNSGQWAGKDRPCDYWLTSEAALNALKQQLIEIDLAAIIIITGLTLQDFAEQLDLSIKAFPCAELDFCLRQVQHLAALSRTQMHIQQSKHPLHRPTHTDRITALKPAFTLQRSACALAEAFASDQAPHKIAQAFKQKRLNAYQQALDALAVLNSGTLTHCYLVDSTKALAAIQVPNPNHPLAVVLALCGKASALSHIKEVLAL